MIARWVVHIKKTKQCKYNVEENDNEDLFREEGYGGKRGFVGNRGLGDWGEVEKYTGFYHRISNSDEELSEIIAVLYFFGMIQIYFPPQGVVISVMFLHGFDNLFNVPR